jgi:uncharacterized membrane protein
MFRLFGHAVHPMLIVFPLGLLGTSVGFDLAWYVAGRDGFATTAGHIVVVGLVAGAVAGIFGLLDWLSVPRGTRARRLGLLHGVGNVVVLGLFTVSLLVRLPGTSWEPEPAGFALSLAGLGVAGVAAWMGGELIERLGVSVHEGANPDASSSLTAARRRPSIVVPRRVVGPDQG